MEEYIINSALTALFIVLIFYGILIVTAGILATYYQFFYKFETTPSEIKLQKSYKKINKRWKRKQKIRKFFGLKYEQYN